MKKALITGITGQDGSYLAEFLIAKGYQVHGLIRKASHFNTQRIDHLYKDPHQTQNPLKLHYGDLCDSGELTHLMYEIKPDEIYHLGAQSHVRYSFDSPEYTSNITALSTTRLLEAWRKSGSKSRFYQASSSEMFGESSAPQNETTPFCPQSPYGISKLYAYWMSVNYRKAYGLYISNGILFNHESPRRGETFVSRKITRGITQILLGKEEKLYMGNLDAKRDWGYAPEYVECQWRMLQLDQAQDFVIGTGKAHSVKEFVQLAFGYVGLNWEKHIEFDSKYYRPLEVPCLEANIEKAKKILNWEPQIMFEDLVKIMMDADLEKQGLKSPQEGKRILEKKGLWYDKLS